MLPLSVVSIPGSVAAMRILSSLAHTGIAVLVGTAALLWVPPGAAQQHTPQSAAPAAMSTVQGAPRLQAATPTAQDRAAQAVQGADLRGKDGPMAHMGHTLATLYYQHEDAGPAGVRRLFADGRRPGGASPLAYSAVVSGGGTFVTIHALRHEDQSLQAALRRLGLEGGTTTGPLVSGRLPISALKEAARLPSLRGMVPAYARTHAGSVGSEADTSHRAFEGRSDLGVDGSGQKICALSDSYDQSDLASTTAADDVASGDLPGAGNPAGRTAPVDVLQDYSDSAPTDEGRAMLQLVHDIAPGATLGFHTAFGGVGTFVHGIRELAGAGCTVLVDDVRYNIEPFYQDGPITNVVDSVVHEGLPYFSSAGNDGQNAYDAPFRDSGQQGVLSGSATAHDFDPGSAVDTLQRITVRPGGTFRIFTLQWTDPSALVEGSAGPDTDLDVALVNDTLGVVSQSAGSNVRTGLPVEGVLEHTNTGAIDADQDGAADSTFHLVIEKAEGPAPDQVKYIHSGREYAIAEHDTRGPTIYGHPTAEGAMAVAAAPFFNTSAYNPNVSSAVLDVFSSKGGIKIRFDDTGAPISSPTDREKPDVTGTDAVDNTFFGDDLDVYDSDPHPNFFGTSAAAPNVAAIAALFQSLNPGAAPADTYAQLEASAVDVRFRQQRKNGTISSELDSTGPGVDPWSGHGFVQATVAALPVALTRFEAVWDGEAVVLRWATAAESNNAGFGVEHKRGDGRFQTIAYRNGAGTTREPQRYRYRTERLPPGSHTFRLRQEDLDGSATHSKEITAQRKLSGTHSVTAVTPNPVSGNSTVSVVVTSPQVVRVRVYDVLGRQVARLHSGPVGANVPLSLAVGRRLQSGVYILHVKGETFATTRKFARVR